MEYSVAVNRCGPVPGAAHVLADSRLALQGHVVNYTCDVGFVLRAPSSGQSTYNTMCDGLAWSNGSPECTG